MGHCDFGFEDGYFEPGGNQMQDLETWIKDNDLEDLRNEWDIHLGVYGVESATERENLIRLLFISLRDSFPTGSQPAEKK